MWTIYLALEDEVDQIDADSVGEVDFHAQEIYIRDSDLSIDTVRHELWHVYLAYCFLVDTNIGYEDMNEVTAALFANRAPTIIAKADEVLARLTELRDAI